VTGHYEVSARDLAEVQAIATLGLLVDRPMPGQPRNPTIWAWGYLSSAVEWRTMNECRAILAGLREGIEMTRSTHTDIVNARIRGVLAEKKVAATAASAAIGLAETGVSKRLRGQVRWTIDELLELAKFLDVPLSQLVPEPTPAGARQREFVDGVATVAVQPHPDGEMHGRGDAGGRHPAEAGVRAGGSE
jgi:hypothetical protein